MLTGRVLAVQALKRAAEAGHIRTSTPIPKANFQPSSLDLRFGPVAYKLRASFLSHTSTVARGLERYAIDELAMGEGGIVLEPRRPYVIPLRESLALPEGLDGFVNPKSSAGRVDTLCRVLTDRSDSFDEIRAGYNGPLYVEIVSRTFPLLVRPDMTLVQLRLFDDVPGALDGAALAAEHERFGLVCNPETDRAMAPDLSGSSIGLSLDLRGDEHGVVGYRAKRNTEVLDFGLLDQEWRRFWEPVYRDVDEPRLVLEPEEFYLLLSQEAITIPPGLAAEMVPYDVRSGEVRTHYAGFFDPGFGYQRGKKGWGSRATLEVRAHDVPFVVEQGQRVCRMVYSHLDEHPDFVYGSEISSNYQAQIVTLSKHFTRPTSEPDAQQLTLMQGA
ncbi:MAG TPA: 2'-deoxycytidine 5'-triphosphate deaminase [Acidimicrobiales bacterium]|nr:2'-deoxycytidine 5'-triphosphate deaminase [Acidimicrobiales bacterium]